MKKSCKNDVELLAEFIVNRIESLQVSENLLIEAVQKVNNSDLESMAKNYFGVDFKRLLHTYNLGERRGELLRNNLQKEFVRHWIFENSMSEISTKENLVDKILGKTATNAEMVIANSIIQWLGTNVGLEFVKTVLQNNTIE